MKNVLILVLYLLLVRNQAASQGYHALGGSSYAGVLGVDNNPASILNAQEKFDINILSFQLKYTTNAVTVLNYSLISSPATSKYRINGKDFRRYGDINLNVHLLNARIALDKKQAIAFGVNVKSYSGVKTAKYNFSDTIKNIREFLVINEQNQVLSARLRSSSWFEYFGTYSRTLVDRESDRLHAGLTLKVNQGISGVFANVTEAGATRVADNTRLAYQVRNGSVNYGYSANLDDLRKDRSSSENVQQFFSSSSLGFSVDLGFEYLVKNEAVLNYYDESNYYEYDWKFGVSLLDFGQTTYNFGRNSRALALPKANLLDRELNNKFVAISNKDDFTDSISTVFNSVRAMTGKFAIVNPARMVVNIDRSFGNNLYLNGELSLNLSSAVGRERLYVSELNMLAVTPRWETRRWGAYLPMLYNMQNQFWVGGAVKAGPVLLGIHNWANVLSNNKMHRGGGYLAFVFRPRARTGDRPDKRFQCP